MSKKITFGLSTKEINRAIREIEQYKRELTKKVSQLIKDLTEYGVDVAKVQIRELGAVYTGDLVGSIEGYFDSATQVGIIKAGSPYAVFVEFGTGIVGEGSQHPAPDGWRYDVNNHGEAGWWYYNDRDQKWHWTKGMVSRPFMYNTAQILKRDCAKIAREVFGR